VQALRRLHEEGDDVRKSSGTYAAVPYREPGDYGPEGGSHTWRKRV
jgi:hypothetical protein